MCYGNCTHFSRTYLTCIVSISVFVTVALNITIWKRNVLKENNRFSKYGKIISTHSFVIKTIGLKQISIKLETDFNSNTPHVNTYWIQNLTQLTSPSEVKYILNKLQLLLTTHSNISILSSKKELTTRIIHQMWIEANK